MEEELKLDEVIKIVAGETQVFYVEKCYAFVSRNIEVGLGCLNIESQTKEFRFPDIKPEVMELVIQYMHYKFKYQQLLDKEMIQLSELPEFKVPPELALDVLIAASYLQC